MDNQFGHVPRKKRDPTTYYPGTKVLINGPQIKGFEEADIPKRIAYNPTGQPTSITLNTHHCEKFPTGQITQWDVCTPVFDSSLIDHC